MGKIKKAVDNYTEFTGHAWSILDSTGLTLHELFTTRAKARKLAVVVGDKVVKVYVVVKIVDRGK